MVSLVVMYLVNNLKYLAGLMLLGCQPRGGQPTGYVPTYAVTGLARKLFAANNYHDNFKPSKAANPSYGLVVVFALGGSDEISLGSQGTVCSVAWAPLREVIGRDLSGSYVRLMVCFSQAPPSQLSVRVGTQEFNLLASSPTDGLTLYTNYEMIRSASNKAIPKRRGTTSLVFKEVARPANVLRRMVPRARYEEHRFAGDRMGLVYSPPSPPNR